MCVYVCVNVYSYVYVHVYVCVDGYVYITQMFTIKSATQL